MVVLDRRAAVLYGCALCGSVWTHFAFWWCSFAWDLEFPPYISSVLLEFASKQKKNQTNSALSCAFSAEEVMFASAW